MAAPTGVTASGSSASSIILHWNASLDPSVTAYDVYAQLYFPGHGGGRGGFSPGHYYYAPVGTNLTGTSDTIGNLQPGSTHTYAVTAVSASGQSPYSALVSAKTWIAPSKPNGGAFLLSNGALSSQPVTVTAGLTTQITILAAGNPLKFAVESGPPTASIDSATGVVTYTPSANETGTVTMDLKAYNSLGAITQTVTFNVIAPKANVPKPTIKLSNTTQAFNGQSQGPSISVVGSDGVTRVNGTTTIAFNGVTSPPRAVGTYQMLVTFTSADPAYADATLLGTYTITRATPVFTSSASPHLAKGTPSATITGNLAAAYYVHPSGEGVRITLNGITQTAAESSPVFDLRLGRGIK